MSSQSSVTASTGRESAVGSRSRTAPPGATRWDARARSSHDRASRGQFLARRQYDYKRKGKHADTHGHRPRPAASPAHVVRGGRRGRKGHPVSPRRSPSRSPFRRVPGRAGTRTSREAADPPTTTLARSPSAFKGTRTQLPLRRVASGVDVVLCPATGASRPRRHACVAATATAGWKPSGTLQRKNRWTPC